jgi:hypothetical protein
LPEATTSPFYPAACCRIESIGAAFHAFPKGADFDLRDFASVAPELKTIPPGPEWLRVALERIFVDTVPAQHEGLQQVLRDFPADIVIGDDMLFGVLPMLVGPRSTRPPIVLCGTSFLHWHREDGAPHFVGLPPATTKAQRDNYAVMYREHDRLIYQPVAGRLNRSLQSMGVGPLSTTPFDSVVELADAYLQLTVPGFEFPRDFPPSVHSLARRRSFRVRLHCRPGPTSSTARARWSWLRRERWPITISVC